MTDVFYNSYRAFLGALCLGVFFGVLYDVFRILRVARVPNIIPQGRFYKKISIPNDKMHRKNIKYIFRLSDRALTFIEDIIFWILITLGEMLFIYHVNGGEIRIYFFLLTLLGTSLYFFTAGKVVMYFSVRIIFIVRCLLYWTFFVIIYPIKKIFCLFKRISKFIYSKAVVPVLKCIYNKREAAYSARECARLLAAAEKGFKNDGKKSKKEKSVL